MVAYVIINGEPHECRAQDPLHCPFHIGIDNAPLLHLFSMDEVEQYQHAQVSHFFNDTMSGVTYTPWDRHHFSSHQVDINTQAHVDNRDTDTTIAYQLSYMKNDDERIAWIEKNILQTQEFTNDTEKHEQAYALLHMYMNKI